MWSIGVIAYVLHMGCNPFRIRGDRNAAEGSVLRRVAQASFERNSPDWAGLSEDARDFIESLLRVDPAERLSPRKALQHPYLMKKICAEPKVLSAPMQPCQSRWERLDGFQQLAWLAVARAVAEPELERGVVSVALQSSREAGASVSPGVAYLARLAQELSSRPVKILLRDSGAWAEVVALAFRYLDGDGDGLITAADIASHLLGGDGEPSPWSDADGNKPHIALKEALREAQRLAARWQRTPAGLCPADLRAALGSFKRHTQLPRPTGSDEGVPLCSRRGGVQPPPEEDCRWADVARSVERGVGLTSLLAQPVGDVAL